MCDQYFYLAINLASVLVPLLASFYPGHSFYREWKPYFKANLVVAFFFIVWDMAFTHMGVWGFNPHYLTGYYLYNLPVEEVLFFFLIPYSSVFIYFSLDYLLRQNPLRNIQRSLSLVLGIVSGLLALVYYDRWYTASTFGLTAAYLLWNYARKQDLSRIFLAYGFVLPFFFLVNGILTGSFIASPIVWYNNAENLGIRMGTIPVEDSAYGFLLIGSIIQIFEYFRAKTTN